MALWHCKTLETFAVQKSHSAICSYVAGTVFPAEFAPGEAEKRDIYVHQTGNVNLQQDQLVVTVKIPGHSQFKLLIYLPYELGWAEEGAIKSQYGMGEGVNFAESRAAGQFWFELRRGFKYLMNVPSSVLMFCHHISSSRVSDSSPPGRLSGAEGNLCFSM